MVDEPAKEMLNVAGLHFSQGGGPYVRGSDVLPSLCGGPISEINESYELL